MAGIYVGDFPAKDVTAESLSMTIKESCSYVMPLSQEFSVCSCESKQWSKLVSNDTNSVVYCSPVFPSGESCYKWRLAVKARPNGYTHSISAGLILASSPTPQSKVNAKYHFELTSGERKLRAEATLALANEEMSPVSVLGDAYKNQATIKVDVKAMFHKKEKLLMADLRSPCPLDNKIFNDVTLKVKGKNVPAHRMVLSVHSPVFAAMFQQDMVEKKTGRIDITDFEPDTVREMVSFMYTGQLSELEYKPLIELLRIADKYAIENLKNLCQAHLLTQLQKSNALEILPAADQFQADRLKEKAAELICSQVDDLTTAEGYETLRHFPDAIAYIYSKKNRALRSKNE